LRRIDPSNQCSKRQPTMNPIWTKPSENCRSFGEVRDGHSTEKPLNQNQTTRRSARNRPLYDFIYRLTCDVVHFNPQVLLRSGWGDLPNVRFSTGTLNRITEHSL